MYALKRFPVLATLAAYTTAQSEPIAPSLAFMYHMDADLGDSIHMGAVPHGQDRTVIPILGGTFKGPQLSGKEATDLSHLSRLHWHPL